ncbi:MAG: N-acetyl sugar amidotransferase [Cyclobacteriaceae bacterium]|nr:N-acetyl sugar amidotransferase [Cyclobacteriaceae bacterium]
MCTQEYRSTRNRINQEHVKKLVSMYKQCTNCILDSNDDAFITFNEQGICNHCQHYKEEESRTPQNPSALQKQLQDHIDKIKSAGVGKPYDCILGISGGVDSTYLALKAKEFGLRPLLVHFDNGWNSELAIKNIENIVTKLGFDLHTIVIDWEEFRDLQLAFLRASVVDIELLTDHAIVASLYQLALQHQIKYILSGVNFVTESILPSSWIHDKRDYIHIRAINKLFGTREIVKYPILNSWLIFRAEWLGVKSITLLNYLPYVKDEVKKVITNELQWRDYGGKHYESVFTRFYQGYILVRKFGIDKRKAHYSNLICSGQITREDALAQIQKPAYDPQLFATDYEYVLKKFKLTKEEFEEIMSRPAKKHSDYPVATSIFQRFTILKLVRPLWVAIKKARIN